MNNEESKIRTKIADVSIPKIVRKSKVKKEVIPKAFIDHIKSLGFMENDAPVLYQNKDDWMGLSTGKLKIQV